MGNVLTTECPKQECPKHTCPDKECPKQECPVIDVGALTREQQRAKLLEENLAIANNLIIEKDKLIADANRKTRETESKLQDQEKSCGIKDAANKLTECNNTKDKQQANIKNIESISQGHLNNYNKCVVERNNCNSQLQSSRSTTELYRQKMIEFDDEKNKTVADMKDMVSKLNSNTTGHKMPVDLLIKKAIESTTDGNCGPSNNKICAAGEYCNVYGRCGKTENDKMSPFYQYRLCKDKLEQSQSKMNGCQENPCLVQ